MSTHTVQKKISSDGFFPFSPLLNLFALFSSLSNSNQVLQKDFRAILSARAI